MAGKTNLLRSAIMMLLASVFIASTTVIAKTLGLDTETAKGLHPLQVSAGRFVFAFAALSAVVLTVRPKFTKVRVKLHLARSVLGWSGVTLMFAAVARMPVSDATAISFLNPVFGMLLAIPLLGERVGPIRWTAAGVAFIGALILLRPGVGTFQTVALVALLAAFLMGLEVIIIKKLTGTEAPLQILTCNNAIGSLIALTAASFVWVQPTAHQWLLLMCLGFLMVSAQSLFIQSMRSADASFALPFSYAVLVFATLFDFWIYYVRPDWISILGAVVILSGALSLVLRESYRQRKVKQIH